MESTRKSRDGISACRFPPLVWINLKINNLLLQDSEIPLQIDKQNKVEAFDSIDTNFLGQLLQSQKEQIAMLSDEKSSKNCIITELLQTIKILNENSHLNSVQIVINQSQINVLRLILSQKNES